MPHASVVNLDDGQTSMKTVRKRDLSNHVGVMGKQNKKTLLTLSEADQAYKNEQ